MKKKRNPTPTINDLCVICKKPYAHTHEVFFGNPDAALSQKYGMTVRLCHYHHLDGKAGVHFNDELNRKLKREFQYLFIEMYPDLNFIKIFGRNYL